jgi:hypothetical protein
MGPWRDSISSSILLGKNAESDAIGAAGGRINPYREIN